MAPSSVSWALVLVVVVSVFAKNQDRAATSSGSSGSSLVPATKQALIRLPYETKTNNSSSGNQQLPQQVVRIRATAIYISKAEFPLSRLLFRLTLKLALEAAERPLLESRVSLALKLRVASTCTQQYAAAIAAEEYFEQKSRLFIVSGCDEAIKAVSRLASQWQVPLMTAAGFSADLNDKSVHKSLIRVAFSLKAAVEFLLRILKTFKWRRVNLIVDESDPNSLALKESIESNAAQSASDQTRLQLNTLLLDFATLAASGSSKIQSELSEQAQRANNGTNRRQYQFEDSDRWPNDVTERAVGAILQQSASFSRVNILLIPQLHVRKFMLSAYDQNMAHGQNTFISIPLLVAHSDEQQHQDQATRNEAPGQSFGLSSTGDNEYLWHSAMSSRNAQARQAFESLMSIYLKIPSTKAYGYYTKNITQLAKARYASRTNSTLAQATTIGDQMIDKHKTNYYMKGEQKQASRSVNINPYSAAFYDCIQIYASAVRESLGTLQAELNRTQRRLGMENFHSNLSNLMRNRRYSGMLTGSIYINKNGDRESDYTLDDMNHMNGKYWPVILYKGETRELERLSRIHWSSDPEVGETVDDVECHLTNTCPRKAISKFVVMLLLLATPLSAISVAIMYLAYRHLRLESQLVDYWWKIKYKDIKLLDSRRKAAMDGSVSGVETASMVSSFHLSGAAKPAGAASNLSAGQSRQGASCCEPSEMGGKSGVTQTTNVSSAVDACYGDIVLATYKLSKVALKPISKFHQSRKLMVELRTMKAISHQNLNRFIGVLVEEPNLALVSEFCAKGSLRELFHSSTMIIDWTFKYSIINDILAGLLYLHSSPIEFHGRLKSGNCLVSSRFVVKLSDYGLRSLHDQLDRNDSEESFQRKLIWRAPEHMQATGGAGGAKWGSKRGDVYSFGLLLYEIITNSLPFFDSQKGAFCMPLGKLCEELRASGITERSGLDMSALAAPEDDRVASLIELMQQCWQFDPNMRPSSVALGAALKKITHVFTPKKLLENLTERMEQYTSNLESLVDAKLATLIEEKLKSEELLYQFVPKSIVSILKEGQTIEPEYFDCVTVFFSDVVGFTSLSSESSPMQVIDFLSELYLCFDEILDKYDIFKIDIIGDAYIVASGLPQINEGRHVIEVARAALDLRQRVADFSVPHKPSKSLEMRVGIHSGPCVGGIVGGANMPKYCVFGDTLSVGKFMESSGLPMKIHLTEDSKKLLDSAGGFRIEPRIPKVSKDGLQLQTYWLEEESKPN